MGKPLCIDLFCGLGGWAEGFLAEGYDVVGFDIERHRYPSRKFIGDEGGGKLMTGKDRHGNTLINRALEQVQGFHRAELTGGWDEYPGQLVLRDILTLHGSQFRNADVIVASPPCQTYSWMAMPFSRGKREAAWQRWERDSPFGDRLEKLNRLFDACFRIQREACEAAGNYIPMVVENVRGAQPWVGRSKYNYGSFHLWGDVPALMPTTKMMKNQTGGSRFAIDGSNNAVTPNCARDKIAKAGKPGRSFQSAAVKVASEDGGHRTDIGKGARFTSRDCGVEAQKQPVWFNDDKRRNGDKCGGDWFSSGENCSLMRSMGSKSSARKAASAQIAKIPLALSQWIAQCYYPHEKAERYG